MIAFEREAGSNYEIDNRSVKKLLMVLERWKLINAFETTIQETGVEKKVDSIWLFCVDVNING